MRQRSDHNPCGNANQLGLQLKSDTLKIVQDSGVVLFQNTHSLVSFDSETRTAAFSVHNLLHMGSFDLCHSDTTKPRCQHRLCFLHCRDLVSTTTMQSAEMAFLAHLAGSYRTHYSLRLLSKSDRPTSLQHRDKLRQHTEAQRQQVAL